MVALPGVATCDAPIGDKLHELGARGGTEPGVLRGDDCEAVDQFVSPACAAAIATRRASRPSVTRDLTFCKVGRSPAGSLMVK